MQPHTLPPRRLRFSHRDPRTFITEARELVTAYHTLFGAWPALKVWGGFEQKGNRQEFFRIHEGSQGLELLELTHAAMVARVDGSRMEFVPSRLPSAGQWHLELALPPSHHEET